MSLDTFKTPPRCPKKPQRCPQKPPRCPQDAPRRPHALICPPKIYPKIPRDALKEAPSICFAHAVSTETMVPDYIGTLLQQCGLIFFVHRNNGAGLHWHAIATVRVDLLWLASQAHTPRDASRCPWMLSRRPNMPLGCPKTSPGYLKEGCKMPQDIPQDPPRCPKTP